MAGKSQFKLAFGLAVAVLGLALNVRADTGYQEWLATFARTNLAGAIFGSPTNEALLIITTIEGEGASPNITKEGWIVSKMGFVYSFRESGFGLSGGVGMRRTISSADLKKLDRRLAALPSDHGRLPPPDRRLLVQADVGHHLVTWVYDRANLPNRLREILRLADCYVAVWTPQFNADSKIDTGGFEFGGFLALSPDKKQILYAVQNRPLQFWSPTSHELLAEVRALPQFGSSIAYSPDGSMAAIAGDLSEGFGMETSTGKVLNKFHKARDDEGIYSPDWPVFLADGRHLLLQYDGDLAIFDTANWQRVFRLPEIPVGARQYIPSPDNKRAVVTMKAGDVVLWDVQHLRSLATLAQDRQLSLVSFSPEGSRFATVTTQTNSMANLPLQRLQIWKTADGRLVKEMELNARVGWSEAFNHLLWFPDGENLLAAAGFGASNGRIDVFEVKTGRLRGCFFGPGGGINGIALTADNAQLIAGGNDGKIYFWNFTAAMKEIKVFESSLAD